MILEFLKVLLSWPIAAIVLGMTVIFTFKSAIEDFIRRLKSGEAYGLRVEATSPAEQRKEAQETKDFPKQNDLERYVKENPARVIQDYQKIFNSYWFERAYNLIYGTQIDLLDHLSQKGETGEKYVNLLIYYNEFVRRSNLSSTQFADYVGFLRDMGFAEITGDGTDISVKITPYGVDFMSYIKGQYPAGYRYRAF